MKNKKNLDLPDTEKDKRQLKAENFEIEIPDVKDIPGQENIHIPPPGEMADTTISSADEEGSGILDNPEEQDEITNQLNANVTKDERKVLDDASKKITSQDQENLDTAKLDEYDEDGELLNEKNNVSGNDLDVPGSELDDDNEEIGEEDEENNSYSVDEENEDTDINTRQ